MFRQTLFLAATYYLTGKLGLLLAVPPGYATLMWPPSGLSIAALLIFGTNRWPGILLGAFLINFRDISPLGISIALGVAAISTFALWLGAHLVKKTISFPKAFYSDKNIILFLSITGPFTALVTSCLSIGILFLAKKIQYEDLLQNWLYWFIGDATGGVIFAPLALMLAAPSRHYWRNALPKVLLPLLAFMGLVTIGARYYQSTETAKYLNEFQSKAQLAFGILERDLSTQSHRISILNRFFTNSTNVTEEEFHQFSDTLLLNRPEIHAYIWLESQTRPQLQSIPKYFKSRTHEAVNFNDLFSLVKTLDFQTPATESIDHIHASSLLRLNFMGLDEPGYILSTYTTEPAGVILGIIRIQQILENLKTFISAPKYRTLIEQLNENASSTVILDSHPNGRPDFSENHEFSWSSELKVGDKKWRVSFFQNELTIKKISFLSFFINLIPLTLTFLTCALLLILFSRVITIEEQVKEKTKSLEALNRNLTLASKTKSDFLANMSHEIRTPLNVLIGMPDLLDESNLTHDQKRYLEISRKAGNSLLHIINDILDLSKIESGQIILEKSSFSLKNLLHDTVEIFSVKCQEKKIGLQVELSPELSEFYLGDSTRIRQILSNLISNSVKFTSQGRILIRALPNKEQARPGTLLIEVTDTGIGIPPDKINNLFRPFTQADASITRKYGGTGLGLSICKRLTEMMNGTIRVESDVTKGTTFSFTLDLPATQKPTEEVVNQKKASQPGETSNIKSKRLKILIVDDTDDNRMLIKAFLKNLPHELFEATNGEKALEFIKQIHPDLILMDMQMPVMDGYTATKAIREFEKSNNLVPTQIWALTAYALKNEVTKSLEVGCNLHLVKPIRRNDLISAIQKLTV